MKRKFCFALIFALIVMNLVACSSQSSEFTIPDYATVTAGELEGYEEYLSSSFGYHYTGTTYCNEDETLFQGYFYALRPLGQYHTGIQGPEDEAVIVKGTYAYNVRNEKIDTLKISIATEDCELKDLTISHGGDEESYPVTLSEDGTAELKLDYPIGEGDVSVRLRGTLVYEGTEYEYDQQI